MVMIMLLAHNTTNLWIHLNLSNIDPTPEQVRLCNSSSSYSRGSPLQSLQTKYVFLKSVVLRIIEWRDAIICLRPFVYIYIDSIQI